MTQVNRRICWFAIGTEQYGVGQAILTLAGAMSRRGHHCSLVVCVDGPLATNAKKAGIPVFVLHIAPPPAYTGGARAVASAIAASRAHAKSHATRVREQIAAQQAEYLHFLWPSHLLLCGMASAGTSCRSIWEMPNVIARRALPINKLLYQVICRRYRVILLANSAYTAASIGSLLVTPRVFYLGVDEERFGRTCEGGVDRHALGIPADAIVLGTVSRLDPSKGQHHAIMAVKHLLAGGENLHLVVAGGPTEGDFWDSLHDLVDEAKIADRVHFLGRVQDTELIYPLFDVFLQTRIDPEPFGLSAVEALMSGVPVVAHAYGGPAETVIDGVTGWHYHDPSVEGLVNALRLAISSRPDWPRMRANARTDAMRRFSSTAQSERFEAILSSTRD